MIVLDKDHRPPFIDLEGGKDLASKKQKDKKGDNIITMFTKKRNDIAKVGIQAKRNDTMP